METAEKSRIAPTLSRILPLVGLTVLFYWQLRHPLLRFAWGPLNGLCFLIALLLPWLALVDCFRLGRWWSRTIAALAAVPVLLFTALALFATMLGISLSSLDHLARYPGVIRLFGFTASTAARFRATAHL
jgi:hypothetical protein